MIPRALWIFSFNFDIFVKEFHALWHWSTARILWFHWSVTRAFVLKTPKFQNALQCQELTVISKLKTFNKLTSIALTKSWKQHKYDKTFHSKKPQFESNNWFWRNSVHYVLLMHTPDSALAIISQFQNQITYFSSDFSLTSTRFKPSLFHLVLQWTSENLKEFLHPFRPQLIPNDTLTCDFLYPTTMFPCKCNAQIPTVPIEKNKREHHSGACVLPTNQLD